MIYPVWQCLVCAKNRIQLLIFVEIWHDRFAFVLICAIIPTCELQKEERRLEENHPVQQEAVTAAPKRMSAKAKLFWIIVFIVANGAVILITALNEFNPSKSEGTI